MVGSIRHGVALLAAMVMIFGAWVGFATYAEHQNNPAVVTAGVHSTVGNTEGKRSVSATRRPHCSTCR